MAGRRFTRAEKGKGPLVVHLVEREPLEVFQIPDSGEGTGPVVVQLVARAPLEVLQISDSSDDDSGSATQGRKRKLGDESDRSSVGSSDFPSRHREPVVVCSSCGQHGHTSTVRRLPRKKRAAKKRRGGPILRLEDVFQKEDLGKAIVPWVPLEVPFQRWRQEERLKQQQRQQYWKARFLENRKAVDKAEAKVEEIKKKLQYAKEYASYGWLYLRQEKEIYLQEMKEAAARSGMFYL